MEYFLHSSLLLDLVIGTKENRSKIEMQLQALLAKNHKLSTSSISLYDFFISPQIKPESKKQIMEQIIILTDEIYSISTKEMNQGLKFVLEYSFPLNSAIDLSICLNRNINKILYTNTDFQTQKLVASIRII
ncbi:MAG: hypothetical protein H7A23_12420 [Leptospiraceae bacterium]|nr:hypothetical protein [Leptospiraceae bacterium]MCP5495353.1 hypothetical protein [Leptospiraceae bacterium]